MLKSVILGDVQGMINALLFFGLGDVSTKVQKKMDSFVDSLDQLMFPVPPVYPSHMLGNNAKELPRLLNSIRSLAFSKVSGESSSHAIERDPRLTWVQWRTLNNS